MLYLAIETWHANRADDVYAWFDEKGRGLPATARVIGSWVDLDRRRCWQVMDVDDPADLERWKGHWTHLMDIEIVPVRSGADSRAQAPGR